VAVGMIYAAHLAHAMQRISQARVEEHYKIIGQTYGLKVKPDDRVNRKELIELMRHDKKAVSGLTFVLDGASGIEVVSGVSEKCDAVWAK
ncbi:MAG: 3-dehydroquinate synthase, partial [Actinomycetota bacterium]